MAALTRALEVAGVEFIEENGGGPGVRLHKRSQGEQYCEPAACGFDAHPTGFRVGPISVQGATTQSCVARPLELGYM